MNTRLLRSPLAAALTVLLLLACSSDSTGPGSSPPPPPPPPPPADVAIVELDAVALTLAEDDTRQLTATPKDANGNPLAGRVINWSSNDQAVARVSTSGLVTALREGTATITATVEGKTADATVSVSLSTEYDLLFDQWGGGLNGGPQLLRMDIRSAADAVRVLADTYTPANAAPSPDGTRIAFVAANGGHTNIFIANRDGTGVRQLTMGTKSDDQPAWSPDGQKIAFRRHQQSGTPADIWVIDVDGSNETNLTNEAGDTGEQHQPAWSPDSRRIVYVHSSRGQDGFTRSRIVSMLSTGSDKRNVTVDGPEIDESPVYSPDGNTILFVRTSGSLFGDLWLASANGGNERALMADDPPGAQRSPAWSADGKLIAFTSSHEIIGTRAGDYHVYTVRSDGTGIVRRTSTPLDKEHPAWIRRLP